MNHGRLALIRLAAEKVQPKCERPLRRKAPKKETAPHPARPSRWNDPLRRYWL